MNTTPHFYRSHGIHCKKGLKNGRVFTDCDCMVWVDHKIGPGKPTKENRIHKSMGTRDMDEAKHKYLAGDYASRFPQAVAAFGNMTREDAAYAMFIAESKPTKEKPRLTVAQLIERFETAHRARGVQRSTAEATSSTLKHFRTFCAPGLFADAINEETFDSYKLARKAAGIEGSTLGKELAHLRMFWKMAEDRGWGVKHLPADTFAKPRVEAKQKPGYTDAELAKIFAAIPKLRSERDRLRARALVLLLLNSGLAIVDAAKLRRDAVDAEGRLRVKRQKTSKQVDILLQQPTVDALRALPIESPEYFFWSGTSIERVATHPIRGALQHLLRLADVVGNIHKFRHTTARFLRDAGASDADAAKHLGHDTAAYQRFYSGEIDADRKRRDELSARIRLGVPAEQGPEPQAGV